MGKLVDLGKTIKDRIPKAIINPDHERWEEFMWKLMGRGGEYCKLTHKTTRAVLQEMQGVDVEGTLEFLKSQEGFCDIAVLLNVVPGHIPYGIQQALLAYWMGMVPPEEGMDDGDSLH
jgi:hypothetical protein